MLIRLITESGKVFCDFCNEQPVVHSFSCKDFVVSENPTDVPSAALPLMMLDSRGAWAVCHTCCGHVLSTNIEELAARAMHANGYDDITDEVRLARVRKFLLNTYKTFYENMIEEVHHA